MARIGRGVTALAARAQRLPVAHGNARELAARAHAHGATVLLRARDPVRNVVVGGHAIAARGESLPAFDERCIPPGFFAQKPEYSRCCLSY